MPLYSYLCEQCNNDFDEVFSIKDYKSRVDCPKCTKTAYRSYKVSKKEPGFEDKLYPYHDFSLNKTFEKPSDRKAYLKKEGLEQKESKNGMNRDAEKLMYSWRLGKFDPRKARYSN